MYAAVAPAPQEEQASGSADVTEQIKKLAELRDQGILTEEEFQVKKKELLAKL
ncbi:MAG: SHOCT domain-containing protein [Halobacteriota archaeon]